MSVVPSYVAAVPGGVHIPGDRKEFIWTGTVGAADTYVTGGFTLPPAQVGLQVIEYVRPTHFSSGHWGVYVPSTGLIKVFSAAGTELANASTALQNATFVAEGLGH